jgi:hypothetical protein
MFNDASDTHPQRYEEEKKKMKKKGKSGRRKVWRKKRLKC